MAKFILLYKGPARGPAEIPAAELEQIMQAWTQWDERSGRRWSTSETPSQRAHRCTAMGPRAVPATTRATRSSKPRTSMPPRAFATATRSSRTPAVSSPWRCTSSRPCDPHQVRIRARPTAVLGFSRPRAVGLDTAKERLLAEGTNSIIPSSRLNDAIDRLAASARYRQIVRCRDRRPRATLTRGTISGGAVRATRTTTLTRGTRSAAFRETQASADASTVGERR